jgi:hypothetical protein
MERIGVRLRGSSIARVFVSLLEIVLGVAYALARTVEAD